MQPLETTTGGRRSSRLRLLITGASLCAAVTIAAVLAACGGGSSNQVSDELGSELQQMLDTAVDSPKTVFPGTALYVSQPELGTWAGAAGAGNIDPATPMHSDDTFRAGSIVKPFVAATVLQLVEEGELALDDPLPAVLPRDVVEPFADADRITVRMLLNHTSGLPEWSTPATDLAAVRDPARVWTVSEFLELAGKQLPTGPPGERWSYSNTNYILLSLIVEQSTGESWRAVVRDRVIERLELDSTSLPEPGDVSIGSDAAHGYELLDGALRDTTGVDPSMAAAAGGHALVTTTRDLGRFVNALLAGELFEQAETLEEMTTFVPARDEGGMVGYGLGLGRYELPGGVEMIGHVGTTAGYRAFVGRLPAQEIDIAAAITNPDDPSPVLFPPLELMVTAAS